jgi:hypothetical protein
MHRLGVQALGLSITLYTRTCYLTKGKLILKVHLSVQEMSKVYAVYTVKKASDFPVPSRDVTTQTLPDRVQLGRRKSLFFFYSI